MCRWVAYAGPEIYLEDLIFHQEHSIVSQSLAANQSAWVTNGDGFGVAWVVFSDAVLEPIKLHVEAKRYLCAVDTRYWDSLSPASKHSLELQGGIFNEVQVKEFEQLPYASEATRLRRYDDLAKVTGLSTPSLSHYEGLMKEIALIS